MKKILLILLILYQTIMVVSCDWQEEVSDRSIITNEEHSTPRGRIRSVISSDTFQNGDINIRMELIQLTLEELQKEGQIIKIDYYLDSANPQISVEYPDGTKATIFLDESSCGHHK